MGGRGGAKGVSGKYPACRVIRCAHLKKVDGVDSCIVDACQSAVSTSLAHVDEQRRRQGQSGANESWTGERQRRTYSSGVHCESVGVCLRLMRV